MMESSDKDKGKKKITEVKTFSVPFDLGEIKENLTINTNTTSKEKIVNQAFKFHKEGNISEAAKYYQQFINQGFKDHRIFSNYGNILKDFGKLQDAENYTRKAIELNPHFANAFLNLGSILSDLGKLQEAETCTRKAIELNPHFANAHFNLGNILKDLGKSKEAELLYSEAIKLNPNFADAHYNLGNIFSNLGKSKEAELSYSKAIKLNPNFADAHLNLGTILRDSGKLQQAELSYSKAIKLNPNFADAHLNLGIILKDLGKLQEAELSTRKAIELNPDLAMAYSNLGNILKDLGKLKDAELSTRKAIELNPDLAEPHSNLGNILKDLGKLKDAELSSRKAIELNPNLAKAYFVLSTLNSLCDNKSWQDRLFSESILKNQRKKDLVDIYFARANILEENYNFSQASHCLKKANNLNQIIYGSDYSVFSQKIESCYKVWEEKKIDLNQTKNLPIPIFIVGLPRSGKTMTETILACNNKLIKCGEDNSALEKSIKIYLEVKKDELDSSLSKIYFDNIEVDIFGKSFICNTNPINFIYTGLITSQFPTAKIIYCYRNPLDNIKEIYKKNMANRHKYSSSLVESAYLYIEVYSLMKEYQKRFSSKVYFLNYDDLVTKTGEEIKHLLNWLGWENSNKYLNPNLDPTTIKITRKLDQKRINKNELSSWKNYRDLLKPAIQIFNSNTKFRNLFKQYVEEINQ